MTTPFWVVACNSAEDDKQGILSTLRDRTMSGLKLCSLVSGFSAPSNMKFGTFDSLIKYIDDLAKFDGQTEAILRRIERCMVDLDSKAEFRVISGHGDVSIDDYLTNFKWDDAKFPRSRSLQDNISVLLSSMQKIDDEVKNRMQALTELKQQLSFLQRKETSTYASRDLADLLEPSCVKSDDFVYTDHLTTLVVIIARGSDKEWSASYEGFHEHVVPSSSRVLLNGAEDKDGNKMVRVVLFRSAVEEFRKEARSQRFITREFQYDAEKYHEMIKKRNALSSDYTKQEGLTRKICMAAYSDCLVGWVHLKAMRVFVEALLRYGLPPKFTSFILKPITGKEKKLREELKNIIGSNNKGDDEVDNDIDGSEAFYSYIFFSLNPLSASTTSSSVS